MTKHGKNAEQEAFPFRMVVFDLDGTALHHGKASRETLRALSRLKQAGVLRVAATGRHGAIIPKPLQKPAYVDYIISCNGCELHDTATRQTDLLGCLTPEDARKAVETIKRFGGAIHILEQRGMLGERDAARLFLRKYFSETGQSIWKRSVFFLRWLGLSLRTNWMQDAQTYVRQNAQAKIEKLDAFFEREEKSAEAAAALTGELAFEVAISPGYLEVTSAACSKGNGLSRLSGKLGIAKAEILALGDSGNDLSMIDAAGRFVAMANAEEAVLLRANDTAPAAAENGFARYINGLFEGEER